MKPTEFLKSVTVDELDNVVEAEISAFDEQAPGTIHMAQYLVEEYPELAGFIADLTDRFPEELGLTEEVIKFMQLSACIALGAVCRLAEARDLPELD